uniref:Large ribosomal subunit protein eL19 domain-containing protein n=1 Tax=Arcella intermedia TaxID=1963864 RepID=A0A6B2LV25_9EUKA
MTSLLLQKRLAMSLLKVGQRKVWLDPSKMKVIESARTREAIRDLIAQNVIQLKPGYRGYRTKIDKVLIHNHKPIQRIYAGYKNKTQGTMGEQ